MKMLSRAALRLSALFACVALATAPAMAQRLSYPPASSLDGTEQFGVLQGGGYKTATISQITQPPLINCATHVQTPDSYTAGNITWMSRNYHYWRCDGTTTVQIVIPNWYLSGAYETATPGITQFTASLEYPLGTQAGRFTFSKSNTAIANGLTYAISDPLPIAIARDAKFGIDIFCKAASGSGCAYSSKLNPAFGDSTAIGSAVPDNTGGGTFTGTTSTFGVFPAAIVGRAANKSVVLIGCDSRPFAAHDTPDASGDIGDLERSLSPTYPVMNLCKSSDQAQYFNGSPGARMSLARFGNVAIGENGINDLLSGGATATTIATRTDAMLALLPSGMPAYIATMEPTSSSTDGFVTVANQTVSGTNPARVTENNRRRAIPTGWAGVIEVADTLESARDSGLWKAAFTDDGVHCVQAGCLSIATAGLVKAAVDAAPTMDPRTFGNAPIVNGTNRVPASRALAIQDSGRTFDNTGASAEVVFTLPTAQPNLTYTFSVQNTNGIRVQTGSSAIITANGASGLASSTATTGYVEALTKGAAITLRANSQSEWVPIAQVGTWTIN